MVTRQNFDLSCLRLLIFAVEVRKRLVALRCVCKRQSAEEELPANSRHKTLANRCFRPAAWPVSDPLWYNGADDRLLMPTSTLKYICIPANQYPIHYATTVITRMELI